MKRKIKYIIALMVIMMPEMVIAKDLSYVACGEVNGIPAPVPQLTSIAFTLLIILTPIILIAFSIITLVKAITSGSQDDIMKSRNKLLKKFLAAGIIFVVAAISQFIITKAAEDVEKATILGCINCFLYNEGCIESDSGNDVSLPDGSGNVSTGGIENLEHEKTGSSLKSSGNQPNSNSALVNSCNSTTSTERTDYIFGKGKTSYGNYQSSGSNECSAHATNISTITINVWMMDSSGKYYSGTKSLQINSKLVTEVQNIFKDIYDKSKTCIESGNTTTGDCKVTPIKSIGGYRCPDSCKNHPSGTGIDINPDENYYISGSSTVGNYWKPNVDVYSMPDDGIIVRTFRDDYGWDWGGKWTSLKDYMHFSYLGG